MAQNYNPILVEVEPQTEIDLTRIDRLKAYNAFERSRNLELFQTEIKHYCRQAGYNQRRLAKMLGWPEINLSNRLKGKTTLTNSETKQIVKALVDIGAITRRSEAVALIDITFSMFDATDWCILPLANLIDDCTTLADQVKALNIRLRIIETTLANLETRNS